MQVRQYNFSGFHPDKKNITNTLLQNTPLQFQRHPEFGILAYKAGCSECVELLDKRETHSRFFIHPENSSHFYVQQSYFPLHFRDNQGLLRTIDPRLKPNANQPGVFSAPNQPVPTKYNALQHQTFIRSGEFEFGFNQQLKMYWLDNSGNQLHTEQVDFSKTTLGESGVYTTHGWKHIDIRQVFEQGGVKTDFIVQQPLNIPPNAEWLIFEDEIQLPAGYQIKKSPGGKSHVSGFWQGNLFVGKNEKTFIDFHTPKYYDGYGYGMTGMYGLVHEKNNYKVQLAVPVSFLNDAAVRYPLYLDPWVSGRDSIGNFLTGTIFSGADLAFTNNALGSCDYTIVVTVPGKSQLFDALVDLEYKVSDSLCVPSPPSPSPFCFFFDVSMEVVGPCTSTGQLICNPAQAPFLGTCTTDPNKVPGAGAIRFANFAACVPPQCPDYQLPFTIKNRTFQCTEVCGYNCAIGSFFAVTVEGRTIELTVTADKDSVCAQEPVRLFSFPRYGVPPYRYVWTPSGATDSVSTVFPDADSPTPVTITYVDTAFDVCENFAVASLNIVVKPTPRADAGGDITQCDETSPVSIGGNPTAPGGSFVQWSAEPSSALAFLSAPGAPNPTVTLPTGTTGSFDFIVRVENQQCFQFDTMTFSVNPNPVPFINADTLQVCEGGTITLSVTPAFSEYQWSTGSTESSITVTESGNYAVTVADAGGCEGSAISPQITVIAPLSFTVFPNASIELGNSVTLGADIILEAPPVDSFFWSPGVFLSCTDCPNPVATPIENQDYFLTVISTDGCISTDSLRIRIILPDAYAIPSAFSPNFDGVNDRFYVIKASGVTVKEFKVFNRWGQIVHDGAFPWDGTFKDEPQPLGVYTYLFILQLFEGKEVKEAGTVTLVK